MDQVRSFKNFINSHYLSEGLRITAGILFPAFFMSFFGELQMGIVISTGAMAISGSDTPGPVHHRRNGMLAGIMAIFVVSLLTGFVFHSTIFLGVAIFAICFSFSMLAIYGARAGGIGLAALIVMVLNMDRYRNPHEIFEHAALMTSGALWYMSFSLLLYNFRPYKIVQQTLGEFIQSIVDYLRSRAVFYDKDVDYDENYKTMLLQQGEVQQKQNVVSELIFKTRNIVKESTNTSRILVMMYLEAVDIFERVMNSYQRYSKLHEYFDETGILQLYKSIAVKLADELEEIGIAIKSGDASVESDGLSTLIKQAKEKYEEMRSTFLAAENVEGFLSLRGILNNLQDLADKTKALHQYTTYDKTLKRQSTHKIDYNLWVNHQTFSLDLLINNLSSKSDIFRHSLRISIAALTGYIISLFLPLYHSYWIVLTIVVILKPAFSLTKRRNRDRIIGTIGGVIIGVLILYVIKNNTALLAIMVLLMAASFSFMRINYLINVSLMTPYVIIFFHFLAPGNFRELLTERIIDTCIGSSIAFLASIFLFPIWEKEKIKNLMATMLKEVSKYFTVVGQAFAGSSIEISQQQLARRDAMVALANLSDAFNRMISEPKTQQKGVEAIHRFVVLNHMLVSYISTLSSYMQTGKVSYRPHELLLVVDEIKDYLQNFTNIFNNKEAMPINESGNNALKQLNEQANNLLEKRQKELEQGLLETETRTQLVNTKPVVDQFNHILRITTEINKLLKTLKLE